MKTILIKSILSLAVNLISPELVQYGIKALINNIEKSGPKWDDHLVTFFRSPVARDLFIMLHGKLKYTIDKSENEFDDSLLPILDSIADSFEIQVESQM